MGFSDVLADCAVAEIEQLGDECTFTPTGGEGIPTFAQLNKATPILGEFGQIANTRITVAMIKSVVGRPSGGIVSFASETYKLDKLVDASGDISGDDGFIVRYYVLPVT